MKYSDLFIHVPLVLMFLLVSPLNGTISKPKKNFQKKAVTQEIGRSPVDVKGKNLVTETPKWKDIFIHSSSYFDKTSKRSTNHMVLAYVTPWNNHGYDIVKTFGGKFTHVSPVWLQLKRAHGKNYITGTHDIDAGWVKAVKDAGGKLKVKVVPRLIFEGWNEKDLKSLVASKEETKNLIRQIITVLDTHDLDGIVMEVWSQLPSKQLLSQFPIVISHISLALKTAGFTFILVIPPAVYQRNLPGMFSDDLFNALVEDVDAFSLMTYDFSSFQNPGPNAPLWWVEECIKRLVPDEDDDRREKILVGLNFYGLDHSITGGSHIIGKQYIDVLEKHKPKFQYDDHAVEHFFEYKGKDGRHTVFYPTLYSIQKRLEKIKNMNCGVSIWEVGQGLDFFYDLI